MFEPVRKIVSGAVLVACSVPALAAVSTTNSCSFSDISGAGVSVTDCTGYFSGNKNNAAAFGAGRTDGIQALLRSEFPGVVLGGAILEQVDTSDGSNFNFSTPVGGDAVLGVHWGGGQGGGNTAFYRVTLGPDFSGFDIVGTNPLRGQGGLSNVALYAAVQAVPEPGTYALLLAGLAGVAFVARRRRHG